MYMYSRLGCGGPVAVGLEELSRAVKVPCIDDL